MLNTKPSNRHPQIENVDFYQDVPYLNGGLFRPNRTQRHEFNDKEFDVDTDILEDVLAMLENYTFAADGGVENLDPSVLGNVFEKRLITSQVVLAIRRKNSEHITHRMKSRGFVQNRPCSPLF